MRILLAASAMLLGLGSGCVRAADSPGTGSASSSGLPAALPLRRDNTPVDEGGWKTPVSILLLAGAGGAWVAWRRLGRGRIRSTEPISALHIVRLSSQPLTQQASLHAVQWNGEELLLACTAQNVSVVARRAAGQPPGGER